MLCRFGLVFLSFCLGLVLIEGVLWLRRTVAPQHFAVEEAITDARLGYRPNPRIPGHDARGWRNARALERADVVVFGDSQTYGVNVASENAWPQQLATDMRLTVYQMAYGGFGPAHYPILLNEARPLEPKVILASYYFGNDLLDAYWLIYDKRRSRPDPCEG